MLGGYSGGSGYDTYPNDVGNGGGSYNGGFAQINSAASNSGHGLVAITAGSL